ncbi:protein DpdI [Shewanella algae]|uniref:protein DpdI n=1 Tax=Shewanella algae TaxID=38313 RepID=UPI0011831BBB|nr:protein DpdI [Shewanella algae]MBO2643880.1 hypothetical protein [Shewanella algae]QTE95375.1 hypothetical protein JKK45_02040 [Shewanella algae]TVL50793.1 hypothetical protein AYI98_07635 [Shewanella algae]
MKTLKSQLDSLKSEMALAKKSADAKYIISEYQRIYKKLSPSTTLLREVVERSSTLSNLPAGTSEPFQLNSEDRSQVANAEHSLTQFTQIWLENEREASQSDELVITEASVRKCSDYLQLRLNACWNSFIETLISKSAVEQHFLEQQKHLGFHQVYNDYINASNQFDQLRQQYPISITMLNKLKALSEQMAALKNNMEFEVPEKVKEFFNQLNGPANRVALRLITPDIIDWLDEHGMLDSFSVHRFRSY